MKNDNLYQDFIKKLTEGKSESEVNELLTVIAKYGASQLYMALFYYFTEEDLLAIEKIEDPQKRTDEIQARFKLRTGTTMEEFLVRVKNLMVQNSQNPQLTTTLS